MFSVAPRDTFNGVGDGRKTAFEAGEAIRWGHFIFRATPDRSADETEGGRSMAALDHASAVYVLDRAEEPVLLAIDAGGEEKRVGGAAVAAIAEAQAPQAFNLDRRAASALQLAAKSSVGRVRVDATIAEV